MNITDDQLRQYVDNVFTKYDKDGNFTLDEKELYLFFKDLFASMNFKHNVTIEDVNHSLKQIDANHDGKVTKRELYNALKVIIGGGKPSTGRKEANLPYQQNKQPKYVQPPKQKQKQPVKQQKQQQYDYQQPQKKPQNPQNYQYNQQKQLQKQQQIKPAQKQIKIQQPQNINQSPMQMLAMGMLGPGSFGMGPEMNHGMGMGIGMGGNMGMMGPGQMFGGMGPPGGMGGVPFGFW